MAELTTYQHGNLIEQQVQKITEFLKDLGLPSDNIIADNGERQVIGTNLPQIIYDIPTEVKSDARYLSKFVIGAGFGLFDYALNSIWNEVTIALRNKAISYGLDIFYDAAVGGSLRAAFKTEEDLTGLKDAVLLTTSKKLELISETTYKKLAHILDMRNDIGISHPTNYMINAFELLGWLKTCINEVLLDQPSDAAIQIKAFIDNLKAQGSVIDGATIQSIIPRIKTLTTYQCSRILKTLFGLYVDPNTEQVLRKNISQLIPDVWSLSGDEVKYNLGITLAGYNHNLHKSKYEKGNEFFTLAKGNSFRTATEKEVILSTLAEDLKEAHYGWDNYYKEVPIIEKIMTFIEKSSDIPQNVSKVLLRNIMLARIGRGLDYKNGVSPSAKPYYDEFFRIIGDEMVPSFVIWLNNFEVQQKMSRSIARSQAVEMIKVFRENIVSERYVESLDYLIKELPRTETAAFSPEFKKLTRAFLTWP